MSGFALCLYQSGIKWVTICNGKVNVPWEGKQQSQATALVLVDFAKHVRVQSRLVVPRDCLLEDRMSQR